ncbi:MAG TPA: hypothetical protein VNF47_14520 [Streptosporangiaceae bacterium]|nr:hypothetical protein [Streptosporangiaceae bacterium]
MRIAVTGHMDLTPATTTLVDAALRDLLADYQSADLTGVTCLARGADQIFARAILDRGGQLVVILPSPSYREQKVRPDNLAEFDSLLSRATEVRQMPFAESGREAYEAANSVLLDLADQLAAVWDGQPGKDQGGTGAVVQQARELGKPVHVIWPNGAARG